MKALSRYQQIFILTMINLLVAPSAFAQDGRLDDSFGNAGKIINPLTGIANDVAVQPDGNIVVAGEAFGPDGIYENFVLARFMPDGTLDATFGQNGVVQTDISEGDVALNLVLLTDGKILLAGLTQQSGILPDPEERALIGLVRYNTDGSLDETFGTDGRVVADFENLLGGGATHRVTDLVVDASGTIYVAGSLNGNPNLGNNQPPVFLLVRFMPDGTIDSAFGNDGVVVEDVGAERDLDVQLAPQPDGLVAAVGFGSEEGLRTTLFRYTLNGELDVDFGTGGLSPASLNAISFYPVALTLLSDGKIAIAGRAEITAGQGVAAARFNADGTLDDGYASGGIALTTLTGQTTDNGIITDAYVRDAISGPDGSVLIGGSAHANTFDYFLTRFNSAGTLDASFGTDGLVMTDFADSFDALSAIALQPDGNVVAVGYEFKLARYLAGISTATATPSAAQRFVLDMPYPNPFQQQTNVAFSLEQPAHVRLVAYDVLGREVAVLVDGPRATGTYSELLNAGSLPTGIYLLRLETDGATQTHPVLLTR